MGTKRTFYEELQGPHRSWSWSLEVHSATDIPLGVVSYSVKKKVSWQAGLQVSHVPQAQLESLCCLNCQHCPLCDEVVAFFAPRIGGFLAVLRHIRWQQRREEDEDAVCDGTSSQVSNLHFLRVQAGVWGVHAGLVPAVPRHPHRRGELSSYPPLSTHCFLPVCVQTAGDWADYYRQGPIHPLRYASPGHLGMGPGK